MRKIFTAILTIIVALTSFGVLNVYAATGANLKITGNANFTVSLGGEFVTSYQVKNDGDTAATLVGVSGTSSTMRVEITDNIGSINPGETKSFDVRVVTYPEDGTGTQTGTIRIQYTSGTDSTYTSFDINVAVKADSSAVTPTPSPNLAPELVMTGPTGAVSATVGGSISVNVGIKNAGTAAAESITATVEPSKELTATFLDGSNAIRLISAGSSDIIKLNVYCPKDTVTGTYTVNIKLLYIDSAKKQHNMTASFFVKVSNPDGGTTEEKPRLILDGFTVSNSKINAGDEFTINAVIKNTSGVLANNVQLAMPALSADSISVTNSSASAYYNNLDKNGVQNVSFKLSSNPSMQSGSYPVKFILSYTDKAGTAYSSEYTYYVSVIGKTAGTAKGMLEVVSITEPAQVFSPNASAVISVTVKNTGNKDISDIKITSTPTDAAAIVPKSAGIKQIIALKIGESKTVSFTLSPTEQAKTQCYTVGFAFEYSNGTTDSSGSAVKEQFNQYIGINVSNPEKDDEEEPSKKSTPKIIISKYEANPIIVQAGQEFDLDVTFMNTHASKTVKNIKAVFTVNETTQAKGNVFTPVNMSNTYFVDSIDPKGEVSHHLRMYTVPDASPKNYIINVLIEYEDEEGNTISTTELIGINVKQTSKLDIGDVFLPPSQPQYQPMYINFQIQNTGKVTLNNLKIKFEGEGFDTVGSDIIYGNFAVGSYDYYDATITPNMTGKQTLKLIATYDDDAGERKEIVNEYTVDVTEAMPMDMGGKEGMPIPSDIPGETSEESKGIIGFVKAHLVPVIIGAVVFVAVIVTAVIIFVKKKKKGMEQDE